MVQKLLPAGFIRMHTSNATQKFYDAFACIHIEILRPGHLPPNDTTCDLAHAANYQIEESSYYVTTTTHYKPEINIFDEIMVKAKTKFSTATTVMMTAVRTGCQGIKHHH